MFAATPTLCSTCSLHVPVLHSHSTPPQKEGGWTEMSGNSLLPTWGLLLPGQCGTMCLQPLPAKGWSMSRISCKLKYSSSHVYDLRRLWEEPLPASWHTCVSPRVEDSLPGSESLGVPQAWSGKALRRWLSLTKCVVLCKQWKNHI